MGFILVILSLWVFMFIYNFAQSGTALMNRLKLDEVSFGIGFNFASVNHKGITYKFRLIPIAGYVKIDGNEEDVEKYRDYNQLNCINKIILILSGVILSFVFMMILAFIFNLINYGDFSESLKNSILNSIDSIKNVYIVIEHLLVEKDLNVIQYVHNWWLDINNTYGTGINAFIAVCSSIFSVMIAINIIPLPILSGGQAVLVFIQDILKIKMSGKIIAILNVMTLVLLIFILIGIII